MGFCRGSPPSPGHCRGGFGENGAGGCCFWLLKADQMPSARVFSVCGGVSSSREARVGGRGLKIQKPPAAADPLPLPIGGEWGETVCWVPLGWEEFTSWGGFSSAPALLCLLFFCA